MSHGPKPDPRPDPREELAGVLSAADRPAAALQALRWAFVWSLEVLQEMSADPGEAFAVTVELDEALRQGEELGRVLPAVLAVAEPGSRVEADLRDRQRQLAQKRAEVAELLRHVEERARDEEELRARILEIQELAGRVRELERLDRLSQGLDELRAHRDQLEARLKGLADEANAEEDALAFAAARFIRLSEDRLADLRSSTQMLLDRATAKQKELAEAVRNKRQGTEELSSETGLASNGRTGHSTRWTGSFERSTRPSAARWRSTGGSCGGNGACAGWEATDR